MLLENVCHIRRERAMASSNHPRPGPTRGDLQGQVWSRRSHCPGTYQFSERTARRSGRQVRRGGTGPLPQPHAAYRRHVGRLWRGTALTLLSRLMVGSVFLITAISSAVLGYPFYRMSVLARLLPLAWGQPV